MRSMELPSLPAGTWLGVILERHALPMGPMWSVTIRSRGGKQPVRAWFRDQDGAFEYGLSKADAQALPFFDLTGGGAD